MKSIIDGPTSSGDLEAVKQEILREMRKEIAKAKQEIIDGIKPTSSYFIFAIFITLGAIFEYNNEIDRKWKTQITDSASNNLAQKSVWVLVLNKPQTNLIRSNLFSKVFYFQSFDRSCLEDKQMKNSGIS